MTLVEANKSPEARNLDFWISVVESKWRDTPEFRVDKERLKHLAVICDGNRRSAASKGLEPREGHRLGVEVIKGITQAGKDWGIKHLTFWTWSTENWQRDDAQVEFVMNLASRYLGDKDAHEMLVENEARFTHFGRKDRLPTGTKEAIDELEAETAHFDQYYINLALDYGGA